MIQKHSGADRERSSNDVAVMGANRALHNHYVSGQRNVGSRGVYMASTLMPSGGDLRSDDRRHGHRAAEELWPVALRHREIRVGSGRVLRVTPVFDTYWRFATERQKVFMRRANGSPPPWTNDPVIAAHRFTNVYRAADRVSQYLIRNVIYAGSTSIVEVLFRTLLFKLFNRVETWRELSRKLGQLTWKSFDVERYARVLDAAMARGERIYSAAYIMPSPSFGSTRKHRNHLLLLEHMIRDGLPRRIATSRSLADVFRVLRTYPSIGDFLAFQFAIDINYSEVIDFSEMEFVVAGPGARDGIRKCFADTAGLSDAELIRIVADLANDEFARQHLPFETLWGRSLQLIDYQNLFCEVGKYSRVVHPEAVGGSGRTRIKQRFFPQPDHVPQWYPPKWGLNLPTAIKSAVATDDSIGDGDDQGHLFDAAE